MKVIENSLLKSWLRKSYNLITFLKLTCLNCKRKRYYNTKQTLRTCLDFVYFYFLMFCFKTKQLKVQKIMIC